MAYWQGNYEADEDLEDEDSPFSFQTAQRDGLVFLIDCSEEMFDRHGDDLSAFGQCIKCAKAVLQKKVISSDKDLVAIVFFRTAKATSEDMKNVFVFQALEQPSAERILELEETINMSKPVFGDKFGFSNCYSLYDALWSCQNLYTVSTFNIGHKRIFLFTNEDNPHSDSLHLRRQTQTKARDLIETNVDLELFDFAKPDGSKFNIETFYKELIFANDEEYQQFPDTATRFQELLSRVRAKEKKKRAQTRLDLGLGPGLDLGVSVYNLARRCTVPTPIRLERSTNEEVKTRTQRLCQATGEVLQPQDLARAIVFAERKICFETDEVAQMKAICPVGLKLLGFKPLSDLKRYHHVRPAQFIYPDEKSVEGSTTLFSALLQRCLARNLFPLCRYVPRKSSNPHFVALLPQAEEIDEDGAQLAPSGFHLIFLPFSDDFRKLEYPVLPKANDDQVDSAKDLVKTLTIKYNPEDIENPQLQKHYANLEALALQQDEPEEVIDQTLPDLKVFEEHAGQQIANFKAAVNLTSSARGVKRAADTSENLNIEDYARTGRLAKLTVPILKDAITRARIKTTATKKADLIMAIEKHFS